MNIFNELNNLNIEYLVWKDIHKVNDFSKGNVELDLLFGFKEKSKFEDINSLKKILFRIK